VNGYHDFHQTWTIAICDALHSGRLPLGYSALVERHGGTTVPNLLAPRQTVERKSRGKPTGGILTATPPQTRHVAHAKAALAARGNRVVIRHRLGEVVCIIEIVSPGHKSGQSALRSFVEKTVEFLRQGINVLVVDLLPPTTRDPQGIHKAIWDEIDEESFELPPDKQLTLAAYVACNLYADLETTAYVEPVGVGDVQPDMPAYLDADSYVLVPLETTYQATWASCPADMRELVETGRLSDEEE
jgi:hypothetical protein